MVAPWASVGQPLRGVERFPRGASHPSGVRIPRIVRVIGAHVTAVSTEIAASRVRMQTGRRPAVGLDKRVSPLTPHGMVPVQPSEHASLIDRLDLDPCPTRVLDRVQKLVSTLSHASLQAALGQHRSPG